MIFSVRIPWGLGIAGLRASLLSLQPQDNFFISIFINLYQICSMQEALLIPLALIKQAILQLKENTQFTALLTC